jgi:hypothetical protein
MVGLFSKRFKSALESRKIPTPSFSRVLRKRLAMVCHEFNEDYRLEFGYSDDESDALGALRKAYGKDELRVQDDKGDGDRPSKGFEDFMVFAYPTLVLDALEAFHSEVAVRDGSSLQSALNAVLEEEGSPWRMSDGRMYLVDSRYVDALKSNAADEMRRQGWLGAHEEFADARSHLLAGQADDAIQNANRAFESALQSLLNRKGGTAGDLLKALLKDTALLDGIPEAARKAIVAQVLQGLPTLRHNLGGHGQGDDPIDVPRSFGNLAINLSAAYITFLLQLKAELNPPPPSPPAADASDPVFEDDIPF